MAAPNVSELIASTLERRSGKVRDNVSKNNALWHYLNKKGNVKPTPGGRVIYEELEYAENSNFGWYSGYDPLPLAQQEVFTAAEFAWKQCAAGVSMNGLEQLQNKGKDAIFNLLEKRVANAEKSVLNGLAQGAYADGTGSGGKQIVGLDAAIPVDPTTGTYGGINRATWTFWRSQLVDPGTTPTSATIQEHMTNLFVKCTRGAEHPDLIVFDDVLYKMYMASLQLLQRFTQSKKADSGFQTLEFMGSDVVLDGGIGGYATASTGYFINTNYLYLRPHEDRNMVPLNPEMQQAVNQDAISKILAWAGNLTCSGQQFHGRLIGT